MRRATQSHASCVHSLKTAWRGQVQGVSLVHALILLLVLSLLFFAFRRSNGFKSSYQITATMITLFRTICKRWDTTKRWTKGPSARGDVPQVLPPFEESLAVQTEDSSLAKGKKKKRTRGRGRGRRQKATTPSAPMVPETYKSTQPFDAFLVLDVEATCQQGSSFDYPNEIIVSFYFRHLRPTAIDVAPRNSPSPSCAGQIR